jgi:hypothetical protein
LNAPHRIGYVARELQEAEIIALQNISGVNNRADIGTKNTDKMTFERHGVPLHGEDEYFKAWKRSTNPKWEGVAGLALDLETESNGDQPLAPKLDACASSVKTNSLVGPAVAGAERLDVATQVDG